MKKLGNGEKEGKGKNRIYILTLCVVFLGIAMFIGFYEFPEECQSTLMGDITFSLKGGFYKYGKELFLTPATEGEEIYYTLDGSIPALTGLKYEDGISLEGTWDRVNLNVYSVRAQVLHMDGTYSDIYTQTYVIGRNVFSRYTTPVVFLTGDPAEITDSPDGILFGNNALARGNETERDIHTEMYESDGELIFSQNCGIRAYGGYWRRREVKSVKIYARKEYDSLKTFHTDIFHTETASGDEIDKYKRLVLRNAGNDFLTRYIRDEYAQTLAREYGFEITEGVVPVTCYMNGNYYGLLWLHENYCDKLFKEKYDPDAPGEFVVVGGKESEKTDGTPEAAEFNDFYNEIIGMDFTDDEVYERLCNFLDIENYLDLYAFNLALANYDFSENNNKCFRYYAAPGEEYKEGVFDGRWRFLLHDMDYSMNVEGTPETYAESDFISVVFDENDRPKYTKYDNSFFVRLMEREDCRTYFVNSIRKVSNDLLRSGRAAEILDELDSTKCREQRIYNIYRREKFGLELDTDYNDDYYRIRYFVNNRGHYIDEAIRTHWPEYDQ